MDLFLDNVEANIVVSKPWRENVLIAFAPFTAIISNSIFQLLLSTLSLLLIYSSMQSLISYFDEYGIVNALIFKLHPRYMYGPNATCALIRTIEIGFRLFRRGCEIEGASRTIENESVLVLEFDTPVQADTFQVTGLIGTFFIQGSNDRVYWHTVASSDYRRTRLGLRFLYSDFGDSSHIDHRATWPLIVEASSQLLVGICCLWIAICGFFHRIAEAKRLLLVTHSLLMFGDFAGAAGNLSIGLRREAAHSACQTAAWLVLSAFLASGPLAPSASLALLLFGAARVVITAASDCGAFGDCPHLAEDPPILGALVALSGLLLSWLIRRAVRKAVAGVERERATRDADWRAVLADEGRRASLSTVEALAGALAKNAGPCGTADTRHLNSPPGGPEGSGGGSPSSSEVLQHFSFACPNFNQASATTSTLTCLGSHQAVSSLDQLYSQALGMLPILSAKCVAWAEKSGGVLDAAAVGGGDFGPAGSRVAGSFAGPDQPLGSTRPPPTLPGPSGVEQRERIRNKFTHDR